MRLKLFKEFNNSISSICIKCGNEFWGDFDICDDCKDSDLEPDEKIEIEEPSNKELPSFGIPTTRSQNLYYL
jgi:hypothetical protein